MSTQRTYQGNFEVMGPRCFRPVICPEPGCKRMMRVVFGQWVCGCNQLDRMVEKVTQGR